MIVLVIKLLMMPNYLHVNQAKCWQRTGQATCTLTRIRRSWCDQQLLFSWPLTLRNIGPTDSSFQKLLPNDVVLEATTVPNSHQIGADLCDDSTSPCPTRLHCGRCKQFWLPLEHAWYANSQHASAHEGSKGSALKSRSRSARTVCSQPDST
jgi:hypothetical protein